MAAVDDYNYYNLAICVRYDGHGLIFHISAGGCQPGMPDAHPQNREKNFQKSSKSGNLGKNVPKLGQKILS
jgi:hypothetical protein